MRVWQELSELPCPLHSYKAKARRQEPRRHDHAMHQLQNSQRTSQNEPHPEINPIAIDSGPERDFRRADQGAGVDQHPVQENRELLRLRLRTVRQLP